MKEFRLSQNIGFFVSAFCSCLLAGFTSSCITTPTELEGAEHQLRTRAASLGAVQSDFSPDLLQMTVYVPKVRSFDSAGERFSRGAEKAASLIPMDTTGGCGKALLGVLICPITMVAGLIVKEVVVVPVAMLIGGAGATIQPYLSKDYWQDPVGHYPEQDQGLQRLDLQTRMRDRLIAVAKQQFHYPIIPVTASSSVDSPAINPRTDTPDFLLQVGVTKIGFVGSEVSEDPMLEYVIEATAILSSSSGKKIQTRYLKYKSTPHQLRSWTGAAVNPSEWDTPEPSISSPSRTISEPLERELEYSLDFLAQQILDPLLR